MSISCKGKRPAGLLRKGSTFVLSAVLALSMTPATAIAAYASPTGGQAAVADAENPLDAAGTGLTSTDLSKWTAGTDADDGGRKYASGSVGSDATFTASTPGWLIFDWKMDKGTSGDWTDKGYFTVDGKTSTDPSSISEIGANNTSDLKWKTCVSKISDTESHTFKWEYTSTSRNEGHDARICLSNVHYVTNKTAVTVVKDQNVESVTVNGSSDLSVEPGTKVTFQATAAEGAYIIGWKESADSSKYLASGSTYTTTVYDQPLSLYVESMKPSFEGAGTTTSPYLISSNAQFNEMAALTNAGYSLKDQHFKQTVDLDAKTEALGVVASNKTSFAGSYDGDGKSIVNYSGNSGLFSSIDGATIEGVVVKAADVNNGERASLGALVNSAMSSYIADCSIDDQSSVCSGYTNSSSYGTGGLIGSATLGSITGCSSGAYVSYEGDGTCNAGVLVGMVSSTNVADCYTTGRVVAPKGKTVGGIVGSAGSSTEIDSCFSSAKLQGISYVGGILGDESAGITIENCLFTGSALASDSYAGGIVGRSSGSWNKSTTIDNCVALGSVAAEDGNAGGIAGCAGNGSSGSWSTGTVEITNCYAFQYSVESEGAVARIANPATKAPTITNCFALSTMKVSGVASTADAYWGNSITTDQLLSKDSTPILNMPAGTWTVANGALPILDSIPETVQGAWPGYIDSAVDKAAAKAVIDLIDAIGDVTEDSEDAILAARDAYDELTDSQRKLVTNYNYLLDAEDAYAEVLDEKAAAPVIEAIKAIGTVTKGSKAAIAAALEAYENLTEDQKKYVDNYDVLVEAINSYQQVIDAGEAVKDVIVDIASIGDVTKGSKDAIVKARSAYDALTAAQKAQVVNYVVLTKAEAAYDAIVNPKSLTSGGVTYKRSGSVAVVSKIAAGVKKATVAATVKIGGKSYKVTAVNAKAAKSCKKLAKLTLGKNVKTIGKSAFTGCKKLKTVTVKGTGLTKKSVKGSLKGSSVKTVKVVKAKKKAYKKIFTKANCGKKVTVA